MKITSALLISTFISAFSLCQSNYEKPYAFINTYGDIAFKANYKWVDDFSNGRAVIKKYVVVGNKAYYNYGFIDTQGKEVIPAIYEKVYEFKEDVTWVKKRGTEKFILIDKQGNQIGSKSWDKVGFWFDGMCQVKTAYSNSSFASGIAYKEGFVNTKGEVIIDPEEGYFGAPAFYEGLVCLTKESASGYGFLDKNGRVVIPLKYKQAGFSSFQDGLARVSIGGRTGLINKMGEVVVQPKYGTVSGFGDSLLTVAFGNAYNNFGYCDFNNKVVIEGKYERASSFEGGYAEVTLDGKAGIIDRTGKVIVPLAYEAAYNDMEEHGYFKVNSGTEWYYYNDKGEKLDEKAAKMQGKNPYNIFSVYDWDTKRGTYYKQNGEKLTLNDFCKVGDFSEEGLALVLLCEDVDYQYTVDNPKQGPITVPSSSASYYVTKKYRTKFSVPGEVKSEEVKTKSNLNQLKVNSTGEASTVTVVVTEMSKPVSKKSRLKALGKTADQVLSSLDGKLIKSGFETVAGETAVYRVFEREGLYYYYLTSIDEKLHFQWILVSQKSSFEELSAAFLSSIEVL